MFLLGWLTDTISCPVSLLGNVLEHVNMSLEGNTKLATLLKPPLNPWAGDSILISTEGNGAILVP